MIGQGAGADLGVDSGRFALTAVAMMLDAPAIPVVAPEARRSPVTRKNDAADYDHVQCLASFSCLVP